MQLIKRNKSYILSFVIPAILMLIVFYFAGVYPAGNNTIIHNDLNNQYLALFSYLKQNLGHPSNLLFSTSMNLGGGFFGVITYYLMNPFNLLVSFFPLKDLPIFFVILTVLKISFCGLSMFIFLLNSEIINSAIGDIYQKKSNFRDLNALIISVSYALMPYIINYKECVMWLDGILLLPLVILGLDRILMRGSKKLYFISLFFTLVTNYYFGIIVGLASCFFFISWFFYELLLNNKHVSFGRKTLDFISSGWYLI